MHLTDLAAGQYAPVVKINDHTIQCDGTTAYSVDSTQSPYATETYNVTNSVTEGALVDCKDGVLTGTCISGKDKCCSNKLTTATCVKLTPNAFETGYESAWRNQTLDNVFTKTTGTDLFATTTSDWSEQTNCLPGYVATAVCSGTSVDNCSVKGLENAQAEGLFKNFKPAPTDGAPTNALTLTYLKCGKLKQSQAALIINQST